MGSTISLAGGTRSAEKPPPVDAVWSKACMFLVWRDERGSLVLRDFEEAGDLVVCEEFGKDIAEIAELAKHITDMACCTPCP